MISISGPEACSMIDVANEPSGVCICIVLYAEDL